MTSTDTQQNRPAGFNLWFPLASGPLLWAAFHAIIYAVASLACQKGFGLNPLVGPITGLGLILFGIALVVLALMAFAGFRAYGNWKDLHSGARVEDGRPEQTLTGFIVFSALSLNILFGTATLVTFLSALFFNPCS